MPHKRLGNTAEAFVVSGAPRTLRQPQDRAQLAAHLDPQPVLLRYQPDRLDQAPHHLPRLGRIVGLRHPGQLFDPRPGSSPLGRTSFRSTVKAEIYARDGLDLPRGQLAGWVGKSATLAEPMAAYIGRHALAGPRVHADDTPMPMLSPGRGRTQAARFWAYLRDDRPFGGTDPPAVLYEFTPDREGEHPQRRLRDFQGILQADAYSGFNALYESGCVGEAAC